MEQGREEQERESSSRVSPVSSHASACLQVCVWLLQSRNFKRRHTCWQCAPPSAVACIMAVLHISPSSCHWPLADCHKPPALVALLPVARATGCASTTNTFATYIYSAALFNSRSRTTSTSYTAGAGLPVSVVCVGAHVVGTTPVNWPGVLASAPLKLGEHSWRALLFGLTCLRIWRIWWAHIPQDL